MTERQKLDFGFEAINVSAYTERVNKKLQTATTRQEVYEILKADFYHLKSLGSYLSNFKLFHKSILTQEIISHAVPESSLRRRRKQISY